MDSFLSDTFFKSFSSKYVYVEAATTTTAPSLVLSPVYTVHVLTPMYVISCFEETEKRLQLYKCFLTVRRSKRTSSKFISISIIQILLNITTLPVY